MNIRIIILGLVLIYTLIIIPFTDGLKNRPVEVKLGYLPHPQVLKVVTGEHAPTVAASIMMRVLFYFGTIIEKLQQNVIVRPELLNMYKTLQGVSHLDTYNMDTYYFAQAVFTWETGRVEEVNHLLKQGMAARSWDYWLPFYLGFNYSYFLKDYESAAQYMQKAAELSGDPLFTRLAARFFYESEQSQFGLVFLDTMIKSAKDKAVRKSYEMRRDALLGVIAIERAREEYLALFGQLPVNIRELLDSGVLVHMPVDPYGGTFYLDKQGKVKTTSRLVSQ